MQSWELGGPAVTCLYRDAHVEGSSQLGASQPPQIAHSPRSSTRLHRTPPSPCSQQSPGQQGRRRGRAWKRESSSCWRCMVPDAVQGLGLQLKPSRQQSGVKPRRATKPSPCPGRQQSRRRSGPGPPAGSPAGGSGSCGGGGGTHLGGWRKGSDVQCGQPFAEPDFWRSNSYAGGAATPSRAIF